MGKKLKSRELNLKIRKKNNLPERRKGTRRKRNTMPKKNVEQKEIFMSPVK